MIYAITGVYFGPEWEYKLENMSDNQIAAIYHRLLGENKLK